VSFLFSLNSTKKGEGPGIKQKADLGKRNRLGRRGSSIIRKEWPLGGQFNKGGIFGREGKITKARREGLHPVKAKNRSHRIY